MSVLFDVILALILAVCAFIGYKHGLIKALSKFISYLISFTLANKLYTLLAGLFLKLPFLESMFQKDLYTEKLTFLDQFSHSLDVIKFNIGFIGDTAEIEARGALVDHAVAVLIASVIGFILTFIIAVLLMKLLLMLMDGIISKLPVLGQINGILGAVFGLLNGFFWTWLVTNAFVKFLLPSLVTNFPNVFVMEIANSIIVQLCTKINPITYIIWLINFIFH